MKPKFVQIGNSLVNLEHIISIRRAHDNDNVEGDYVINLSGTRQVGASQQEGEALMKWAMRQSATPAQLAAME